MVCVSRYVLSMTSPLRTTPGVVQPHYKSLITFMSANSYAILKEAEFVGLCPRCTPSEEQGPLYHRCRLSSSRPLLRLDLWWQTRHHSPSLSPPLRSSPVLETFPRRSPPFSSVTSSSWLCSESPFRCPDCCPCGYATPPSDASFPEITRSPMLEVDRLIYDLSQECLSQCRDIAHLLPDLSPSHLLAPPDLAQQHQQAIVCEALFASALPRTPASLSPHDSTTAATTATTITTDPPWLLHRTCPLPKKWLTSSQGPHTFPLFSTLVTSCLRLPPGTLLPSMYM